MISNSRLVSQILLFYTQDELTQFSFLPGH